jgi:23S rRNA pseudouridine1911/1915/1917 synthase
LSRAFIQKLCDDGLILVNGKPAKPGVKLRDTDTVTVNYDESILDTVPDIDLPVLYEDAECVVINKPPGVLTHVQGEFVAEATVASFLKNRGKDVSGERAGIVHRLDRATSGVMIGAKTQHALQMLQQQFANREAHKTYIAVVRGHLKQSEAIIDMPIERNPKAPATHRVGANGKSAITQYKVLKETAKYSLLELKPQTGRTHQLRVHLAHLGHPIVGDPLYGKGAYGDRLYLHAAKLEVTLPDGERRTFEAPLPPEFAEIMQ